MSNHEIHSDDCREVFMLYDRVGDNKIRVDEVGEVLRALGSNPTESELAKLEQQFKVGKDTRISFEAFWPIFQATKARKLTPGKYKHFTFTGDWMNLKPCSNFCTSCLSSPDRTSYVSGQILASRTCELPSKHFSLVCCGISDK
jgi:hypothetical protein